MTKKDKNCFILNCFGINVRNIDLFAAVGLFSLLNKTLKRNDWKCIWIRPNLWLLQGFIKFDYDTNVIQINVSINGNNFCLALNEIFLLPGEQVWQWKRPILSWDGSEENGKRFSISFYKKIFWPFFPRFAPILSWGHFPILTWIAEMSRILSNCKCVFKAQSAIFLFYPQTRDNQLLLYLPACNWDNNNMFTLIAVVFLSVNLGKRELGHTKESLRSSFLAQHQTDNCFQVENFHPEFALGGN